jgi:CspA family cold shock protein
MNPIVKKLIISIIIAFIAFFILVAVGPSGFHGPSSNQDFVTIGIIFFSVLIGSILSATFDRSPVPYISSSGSQDIEMGTVKWFNIKKGYGFITRDQGDDVFVHYRNIQGNGRRAVGEGQRVQFIVIDGDKGLQADEVEAI